MPNPSSKHLSDAGPQSIADVCTTSGASQRREILTAPVLVLKWLVQRRPCLQRERAKPPGSTSRFLLRPIPVNHVEVESAYGNWIGPEDRRVRARPGLQSRRPRPRPRLFHIASRETRPIEDA